MPPVYIHDYRLLSALGSDPTQTVDRLADGTLKTVNFDRSLYTEIRARLEKHLCSTDITDGLVTAGALFFPLIDRLREVDHTKTDVTGFVFGNSTSGLADVLRELRKGDDSRSPELWKNLELGRPASLLARAAHDVYPYIGPAYVISTACTAGAKAIVEGVRLLLSGQATRVIAGGADILNDFTLAGFTALGAVSATRATPFTRDRDGLTLGEGGALLLLSLEPSLKGIPARFKLTGWGESSDAHHISAPLPTGERCREAARQALRMADRDTVDFLLLHGTGTPLNDSAEAAALGGLLPGVPAASPKRLVGHQLAGAGAFSAGLACALLDPSQTAFPLNFLPGDEPDPALASLSFTGPLARSGCLRSILVNTLAFGGSNTALLIERHLTTEVFESLSPEARAQLFTVDELLPQRAPMLLLDRALAITDHGAVSETVVKHESILTSEDTFAPEGLIEIMAQTVGLFAGAKTLAGGATVKPGLLLGTRRLVLPAEPVKTGTRLVTEAEESFQDESGLWQFACSVKMQKGDTLSTIASATLTLFSPPEGYWDTFDKENHQ